MNLQSDSSLLYSFPRVIEPVRHKSQMHPQSEWAEDFQTTSLSYHCFQKRTSCDCKLFMEVPGMCA